MLQAYPFCIELYAESDSDVALNVQQSLISNKSRAMQNALREAYINKGVGLTYIIIRILTICVVVTTDDYYQCPVWT